ncbi:MAG: AAA family ATPase [Saccharofermentanales bacterium]
MRISRLEISNFRGIERFEQDFINPLTNRPLDVVIFAGPNGSGKISILESIVITLTESLTKDEKAFTKLSDRHGKEYSITIHIQDDGVSSTWRRSSSERVFPATLMHRDAFAANRVEYFSSWREPLLKGPYLLP